MTDWQAMRISFQTIPKISISVVIYYLLIEGRTKDILKLGQVRDDMVSGCEASAQ